MGFVSGINNFGMTLFAPLASLSAVARGYVGTGRLVSTFRLAGNELARLPGAVLLVC